MKGTTSKAVLIIRSDNKEIRAYESKFDRAVGDILTLQNVKYKVVSLEPDYRLAQAKIGTFGSTLFQFHKF